MLNCKYFFNVSPNINKPIENIRKSLYNIKCYILRRYREELCMEQNFIDKWISIDEAAEYLGIKTVTLRGWIRKDDTLPAHKVGKQWKFKCSEIDEWVKSGKSAKVEG